MKLRHLTHADYAVSRWSGGTTTQLAIAPEGAVYADRDFLWRISSASVELEESDFTPLPDYRRLICPLEGKMVLAHDGGGQIAVRPFHPYAFDGGAATHSWGRCVDFNLMLRKGRVEGEMWGLETETPGVLTVYDHPLGPGETLVVYCAQGGGLLSAAGETVSLAPGESALLEGGDGGPMTLTCSGPAAFMAVLAQVK